MSTVMLEGAGIMSATFGEGEESLPTRHQPAAYCSLLERSPLMASYSSPAERSKRWEIYPGAISDPQYKH